MPVFGGVMGRVAIVTGGCGALGRGVVMALVQAGAEVVATDTRGGELAAMRANFDPTYADLLMIVQADLTKEEDVARVMAETLREHGKLDILVNIVGGYAGGPHVAETDRATWEGQLSLNLTTAFLMCRAAVPALVENGYGRIVNVSSRVAHTAPAGLGAYAVSKAGILTLTEVLANETRAQGITVNALLPSVIDTPANRAAMGDADAHKWVKPEEIGAVVRFLASPDAAIISGAAIPVYGQA